MNKDDDEDIERQKCKILLLGDSQVGKTIFYTNIFPQEANEHHLSTIGVQFNSKNIKYEGKHLQLEIWDTAGQERYRAITKNFFKKADGILLFYDITKRESFTNIKKWIKIIKETLSLDELSIILLGNKIDLSYQRTVESQEGQSLADSFNAKFIETSGQTGENVNEAIINLIQMLLAKVIIHSPKGKLLSMDNKVAIKHPNSSSGCGCY